MKWTSAQKKKSQRYGKLRRKENKSTILFEIHKTYRVYFYIIHLEQIFYIKYTDYANGVNG